MPQKKKEPQIKMSFLWMSQMRQEWKLHGQKTSLTCFVVSGDSWVLHVCSWKEKQCLTGVEEDSALKVERKELSTEAEREKLTLTVQGQFSQKTEGQGDDQSEIKAEHSIQEKMSINQFFKKVGC